MTPNWFLLPGKCMHGWIYGALVKATAGVFVMKLLNWLGSENSEKMCHSLSKMSAGESSDASDTIRPPSDKYKESLIVQKGEFCVHAGFFSVFFFFLLLHRSQSWPYGASKPTGANLPSVLWPEHRKIAFKGVKETENTEKLAGGRGIHTC